MATNEQTSPEVASAAGRLLQMDYTSAPEEAAWDALVTDIKAVAASALTQAPDRNSDQEQLATSDSTAQSSQAPSLMAQDPSSLKPQSQPSHEETLEWLEKFTGALILAADVSSEKHLRMVFRGEALKMQEAIATLRNYPTLWFTLS